MPTFAELPMKEDDVSPEYGNIEHELEEYGNNENKRMPWMNSVNVATPLKKMMENRRTSTGNSNHPIKDKCKLLRDLCSPEKRRRMQHQEGEEEADSFSCGHGTELLTPTGNKEDIEKVYEKVEILLDALRMERHQEKLMAEYEINSLKAQIASLEANANKSDHLDSSSTPSTPTAANQSVNGEIAEGLLETLAILEEECEEWKASKPKKRKSLDVTTDESQSSPGSGVRQSTTEKEKTITKPSPRERERKIVESVIQLMAFENKYVPEKDRKLLAWYFDEKLPNSGCVDTFVEGLSTKEELLGRGIDDKDIETSKEIIGLQQTVFKLQQDLGEMSANYETAIKDSKQQKDQILGEVEKNLVLSTKLEEVQKELTENQDELKKIKEGQEDKENDINDDEVQDKENSCENYELKSVEQNLAATEGKRLEDKTTRQMKELKGKLNKMQGELSGSKRNYSDVLMKLAVESTSRASLSMKLDAALAQIEKQKETISFLHQELGQAKYSCRLYSQKMQDLQLEPENMLCEKGNKPA